MLDAADILVHWQPVIGLGLVETLAVQVGRAIAAEIPRRFEEGVEGVGFAQRRLAAARAGHVLPGRVVGQRVARAVESDVLGQAYGQVGLGHRHGAAGLAMDDRDGAAPIALARHAPVAQAPVDGAFTQAFRRDAVDGGGLGGLHPKPVQEVGIEQGAVARIGFVADGKGGRVGPFGQHHRLDRQAVLAGEIQIALVMGGAAENGARAVFHQHEIGHVDGQFPAGHERMAGLQAGVDALLLGGFQRRFRGAHAVAFGDELGQLAVALRKLGGQRVVGRNGQEGGAEQGVGAGGEDLELVRPAGDLPGQPGALGPADPVLLHDADALGPAVQRLQGRQQVVGKGGDLEEPLAQQALFHQRARAPAAAVDDLLVGQHGVFHRVPVDPGFLAVDQPGLEEVQEHLLFVAVIFRLAGGDLAAPIIGQAHGFELLAHGGDVLARPLGRMHAPLDGGVLGRQAESVPAHGVQHVEALGALVARDHVAQGIVAHVAHVDAPRRIGEHLHHVILRARRVGLGDEGAAVFPAALPLGLGFLEIITLVGARHVDPCNP